MRQRALGIQNMRVIHFCLGFLQAELKSRAHKHQHVRRTHSDLGGQRILHWDPRAAYRRMMSSPTPLRERPQSPRKKPPDAPGGVQLRGHQRRGQLRRSLSQPLDIDKLPPLIRTKAPGNYSNYFTTSFIIKLSLRSHQLHVPIFS